jgi:hypothetical protein
MEIEEEFSIPITFYKMDQDKKFCEFIEYINSKYKNSTFSGDNLITFGRALTFLRDKKFVETLFSHPNKNSRFLSWRLHTAYWAAKKALLLDGDFVECGVEGAITSTQIINYLDFKQTNKHFYLYDTFGGIPESYLKKHQELIKINHYDTVVDNYKIICDRFRNYNNIHIIKGTLPESLNEACPEKIAFLHLDLSNFPSEYDILEILINKIVPGGMVLFQSFGIVFYECYKIASAPYITERGLSVLELPTGQGLLIL